MALSSIIDTGPAIFTGSETGVARRPGSAAKECGNLHPPRRCLPSDVEGEFLAELDASRQAVAVLYSEREVVCAAISGSPTAHARAATAALVAGNAERARSEATKALQLAVSYRDGTVTEILVSIHSAVVVLMRLGNFAAASELLGALPRHPMLLALRATVVLELSDNETALELLDQVDGEDLPDVSALRGYILLIKGKPHQALTALRKAYRRDPNDIDTVMNMAAAFWRSGSVRKAITFSRQAVALAPDRRDTTLALLNYLVQARQIEAAVAELRQLHQRGVVPFPELLAIQAQIAFNREDYRRTNSLFRSAMESATSEGNETFAVELRGEIAAVDFVRGKLDRSQAIDTLKDCLKEAPKSVRLVTLLAYLVDTVSGGKEAKSLANQLPPELCTECRGGLAARLAYLQLRFDESLEHALAWYAADPLNDGAATLAMFLIGHLANDWTHASEIGLRMIQRVGATRALVNQTAYTLAFAGQGRTGLELLDMVDQSDYVLLATRGLCHIATGELKTGMKVYRSAAELADTTSNDGLGRVLMTLYQAMSLKRLAVLDDGLRGMEILASALPDVDLPGDWDDRVDFRFLEEVARRKGWDWPVRVE